MRVGVSSPVPALKQPWRATVKPTSADIERMLVWMARERRAERQFDWYRARRPHWFVLACPPATN